MKVLLDIKDEKASFVMELLKNLSFVRAKTITEKNAELIEDIREAAEEVKLAKEGRLTLKSAEDLINEL